MSNKADMYVTMSVEEIYDLLEQRGVSAGAFWDHAMGGDRAALPADVVEQMVAEVQAARMTSGSDPTWTWLQTQDEDCSEPGDDVGVQS
jgi:hypothetical protein